ERLDLDDYTLVRCVARHQPAEVGDFGAGDGHVLGKFHEVGGFLRRPGAHHSAVWIVESSGNGVTAPETWTAGGAMLVRTLAGHVAAHGHRYGRLQGI